MAPAPSPFPSHPSRKATVPRPLHLGPICWLPSLPPALNSDVFKHTHQRHRAAPGEPQLAAHFLRLAESGAQRAPSAGRARERACLLPAWLSWSGEGDGGGSRGAFTPVSLFNGVLAAAGGQLCPQNIHRVRAVPPGITSAVTGNKPGPHRKQLGRVEKRKPRIPFRFASWGWVFSVIFSKNSPRSLRQTPIKLPAPEPGHSTNRDTGSHRSHRPKQQGRGHGRAQALKPRRNPTFSSRQRRQLNRRRTLPEAALQLSRTQGHAVEPRSRGGMDAGGMDAHLCGHLPA